MVIEETNKTLNQTRNKLFRFKGKRLSRSKTIRATTYVCRQIDLKNLAELSFSRVHRHNYGVSKKLFDDTKVVDSTYVSNIIGRVNNSSQNGNKKVPSPRFIASGLPAKSRTLVKNRYL